MPQLAKSMLDEDKELFKEKTFVMGNPYKKWPVLVEKHVLNQILLMTQADAFIAF